MDGAKKTTRAPAPRKRPARPRLRKTPRRAPKLSDTGRRPREGGAQLPRKARLPFAPHLHAQLREVERRREPMPDRMRERQVALRALSRPSDVDGRRAKWRTVGRHGPAGAGGWQRGRLTPRGGDRGEAPVRGARGGPRRLAVEGGDTPCAREGASGRGGWGGRGRGHSSIAPPPTRRPSRRAAVSREASALSRLYLD